MSSLPRPLLRLKYEEAAEAYLRSLPLEHFMEATAQATQRKITLESFDLVHARRPEVQVFNELLVQYPLGRERIGQVVPDNMVVVWEEPLKVDGSYDLPLQPASPFLVFEYVSKHNKRKDYGRSLKKYEQKVKVPYYLVFYPDAQELTLFKRRGSKYSTVKPNEQERYAIPELELAVAILDGWVRYWYQGELLPLPADLQRDLDEARRQVEEARRQVEEQTRRAEEQTRRAEEQTRRAEEQTRRAEEQTRRAEEQTRRAEEQTQLLEAERQARQAAEEELARLRGQIEPRQGKRDGP